MDSSSFVKSSPFVKSSRFAKPPLDDRRSSFVWASLLALAAALGFALALAGCVGAAPAAGVSEADSTAATPRLSFNADWTITQSAPLVAGQPAILHYDFARLPRCRATADGVPAWNLYAAFAADGAAEEDAVLTSAGLAPADATITVPYGRNLAVWFHNSDDHGCSDWDSNYGNNFHFAVQSTGPVIHFDRDWTITVDGTLAAGGPVVLDYDLARAPYCRDVTYGYPAWDVTADYRFDGGAVAATSVTQSSGMSPRTAAPARLTIPAGAHSLEVWFEEYRRVRLPPIRFQLRPQLLVRVLTSNQPPSSARGPVNSR